MFKGIDTVNQGNWSLPIESRLEGFVIVVKCTRNMTLF